MKFSKLYWFDDTKLYHVRISRAKLFSPWVLCIILSAICGYCIHWFEPKTKTKPAYDELIVMVDAQENELMSPRAMYQYMKEIGIKYPEIVWSQVALESRFCSQVCKENNNYFGMKLAACRPNVQTGENLGHATYRNWKMSVIDYALWQSSTGVWKLKDEAAYFNYLDQRYAEGANYAIKVKEIRDNFDYYLDLYDKKFKSGELK